MVTLELNLPDGVAKEAEAAGLLQPEQIQRLINEELKRLRVDRLFQAADRLATLDAPPPTEAELEAEIAEARAQRCASVVIE